MVFMLKEGEVRIPSGCAISGVFHKDGRRENGSGIVAGIAAMHERSNGLAAGLPGTVSTRNTGSCMHSMCSTTP